MDTTVPWSTLRQARMNARLTTAQLAEAAGISTTYVSFLERGLRANPSVKTVNRLARALHCTPADIPMPIELEHLTAAHAALGARIDELRGNTPRQGAA